MKKSLMRIKESADRIAKSKTKFYQAGSIAAAAASVKVKETFYAGNAEMMK